MEHTFSYDADGYPIPGCEPHRWDKPINQMMERLADVPEQESDPVNHPGHYNQFPVEVIEVTEHLNFCLGNAVKYILRCDFKGEPIQDLEKAVWYLQREITRRKKDELR